MKLKKGSLPYRQLRNLMVLYHYTKAYPLMYGKAGNITISMMLTTILLDLKYAAISIVAA